MVAENAHTKEPNSVVLDGAGRKPCIYKTRPVHHQVNSNPHKLMCAVITLPPATTSAAQWADQVRGCGETPTKEPKFDRCRKYALVATPPRSSPKTLGPAQSKMCCGRTTLIYQVYPRVCRLAVWFSRNAHERAKIDNFRLVVRCREQGLSTTLSLS